MIYHEVHGHTGPWLVFIPGLTCATNDWRYQVAALRGSCRCLCVDMRGHGKSVDLPGPRTIEQGATDVFDLMRQLDIGEAVLVGHSWGVRAATQCAMLAPDRVSGLVLIDGSQQGLGDPVESREAVLALIRSAPKVADFVASMFDDMFMPVTPKDERDQVVQRAVQMPTEYFLETIGDMIAWDAERMTTAFSQIEVPTTFVQSTVIGADRCRRSLVNGESIPYLDMARKTMPHAGIELVAGVGHFTQLDAPQAVNAVIADVLAQAQAQGRASLPK